MLASVTTLLERAARLEQVSDQKNSVLAHHTVQMHRLVTVHRVSLQVLEHMNYCCLKYGVLGNEKGTLNGSACAFFFSRW